MIVISLCCIVFYRVLSCVYDIHVLNHQLTLIYCVFCLVLSWPNLNSTLLCLLFCQVLFIKIEVDFLVRKAEM
jgi:hypothetical protein